MITTENTKLKTDFQKNICHWLPLFFLTFIFLTFIFYYSFFHNFPQQFSELANSFLHYKLYFLDSSTFSKNVLDTVLFNNHFYWPLGPLPAIFLMPFVKIGNFFNFYFYQGYLNFFLVLLLGYLIFKLACRLHFSALEAAYWSIAFIFSSMFLGVAMLSASWYFAQTIVVVLLFLALLEYFGKKRYFLIGALFGLILLTRVTAFFGILFFTWAILTEPKITWNLKIQNIFKLAAMPLLCLILLFSYNYARFNNPLDQGYRGQILTGDFMRDKNNYGLFNIKYLPRGIYYSLINTPQPVFNSESHLLNFPYIKTDGWGLSIFLTSPYLLYLFFLKIKNKKAIILFIVSMMIWLLIATSYFTGYIQFGFRYALDFMPLLFTGFMLVYKDARGKMSPNLKIIIILSAIFNLYLLLTL